MSLEAEQHLLACVLIDDKQTAALLEIPEDWFLANAHKLIYRKVAELAKQNLGTDLFSVAQSLQQSQQLASAGGMEYLTELTEQVPSLSHWNSYKNILFGSYKQWQVKRLVDNLQMQIGTGAKPDEMISYISEQVIELLTDHHQGGPRSISHYMDQVIADIQWRADNPGKLKGHQTGFKELDELFDGFEAGKMYLVAGRPGCLSGETKLYVSRDNNHKGSGRQYTLAELYRGMNGMRAKKGSVFWDLSIPTMVQSLKDDDLTGLNLAEQVIYSGVKETYTVTTDSGKEIRATKDHLFLTENGFTALSDLSIGDGVICKAPYTKNGRSKKQKYRKEICTKLPYSPYPTRIINGCEYNRVLEQRVSYDAALNLMNMQDFLELLKNDPDHGLVFSDSSKHIHHKDGNVKNNHFSNLELLSSSEHTIEHAKEELMNRRFGKNYVQSEKIVGIEYFGEEETYDIVCADPYNNFIAEGFVTHNSGKTSFGLVNLGLRLASDNPVVAFSLEMTGRGLAERALCNESKIFNNKMREGNLNDYDMNGLAMAVTRLHTQSKLYIDETPNLSTAQMRSRLKAQELKHGKLGAVIVDHVGLVRKDSRKDDTQGLAQVSHDLARMAKEFDCPVIVLSQLNRGVESRNDKRPMMSDLKQSGALEEDARGIMLIYRDDYYNPDSQQKGITEINIAKNSDGETKTIYFNHNLAISDYQPIDGYTAPEKETKGGKF